MEKSYNYQRRKDLMTKLQVPTIGEVKHELGPKMANIVFDQCPTPLKSEFGLVPTLDGPGHDLWISPSDLLIPKVCLKPPLTSKYIKALTHEGILSIGEKIDQMYWNQMEQEKAKALEEQRALITRIADMERRVAIKLARQEEQEIAARNIQHLMQEFEKRLVVELKNLEQRMLELQAKVVKEAVEECDESWTVKMRNEIAETIERMTSECADNIDRVKKELEDRFRMELEKQNTEFNYALKHEQEFCEITLRQLRHCLECKNLANLMYVLCMERRKCRIEQCTLEYIYKNKISDLEGEIHEKDATIKSLTDERDLKQKQLNVREECLLEILKQFQKFINFALRAAPTQAEFLLSVEKMILYEVAKQTWQQGKKVIKTLCKKIIPWKSDSTVTEITKKSDLKPKDYHNCLDEVSDESSLESESLPYFYYRDKLYVRRDMQYYFDHGIQISETNMLWSKDVENLMQILKASTKKDGEEDDDASSTCEEKVQPPAKKEQAPEKEDIPSLNSKHQLRESKTSKHSENSRKSTVSFQQRGANKQTDPLKPALKPPEETTPQVINQSVSSASPPQPVEVPFMENIGLLAAKDSLATIRLSRRSSVKEMPSPSDMPINDTLVAVKETLQYDSKKNSLVDGGTVSFEHIQAIRILDEIELTKPSNRSSKLSLTAKARSAMKSEKESILQKPQRTSKPTSHSKLLHATDSLILHRNSLTPGSHKMQEAIMAIAKSQTTPPTYVSRGSLVSKLSFTKDSLELIRKQSMHAKRDTSVEAVLVLSKRSSKQTADDEKPQKVQKVISPLTVSHIEAAQIPTDIKEGEVRFSPIREVYETKVLKTSDSPWNIYREAKKPEVKVETSAGVLLKPSAVEIVGEKDGKEYLESSTQFTGKRITSILKILKQDPSLIRLFTAVRN